MEPFKHSTCNATLGVSEEQASAGVVPLPINRAKDDGVPIVQSFWKPDEAELKALSEGHPVMITLQGYTHAPIMVQVAGDKE